MKIPCYSKDEFLSGFSTYRERFCSLYPLQYDNIISNINNTIISQNLQITYAYQNILDDILNYLKNQDIYDIILHQLLTLRAPSPPPSSHTTLTLDEDQYKSYDLLCNTWGPYHKGKHPLFFLTGSARTEKSFLLHLILQHIDGHYTSLALHDSTSRESLLKIQAIVIEEISMVSDNLFSFISNLFGSLHQNSACLVIFLPLSSEILLNYPY